MNGCGAAPGALGELHHQLDRYLVSVERPPACADGEGALLFDTSRGERAAALARADGGVQLVACPGYLSADGLQALNDTDGRCAGDSDTARDPLERLWRDLVSRWRDARAQWWISVDRWEGSVHLSMVLPGLPEGAERWDEPLQAFEQAFAHWEARLRGDADGGGAGTVAPVAAGPGLYLVRG